MHCCAGEGFTEERQCSRPASVKRVAAVSFGDLGGRRVVAETAASGVEGAFEIWSGLKTPEVNSSKMFKM